MLDDRFWTKVDRADPGKCWEWTANKNNKGYGLYRPGGTAPKRLAHRLAYEDAKGPITNGLVVRHRCHNPACVNPKHLVVGTQKQNMTDTAWAERIGNTRLTAKKVAALLRDYVAGATAKQLAETYGLSPKSIDTYTGGGAWTHLLGKRGCPSLEDLRAARKLTPNAKITLEAAREIRRRLAAGETGRSVALAYGLHPATISNIRLGRIWRDPDLS